MPGPGIKEALGFVLGGAVTLGQLEAHPSPATLVQDARPSLLALYPHHQLSAEEHGCWRCGQGLSAAPALAAGQVVAVLNPAGALAGTAVIRSAGQLQPKLVLNPRN